MGLLTPLEHLYCSYEVVNGILAALAAVPRKNGIFQGKTSFSWVYQGLIALGPTKVSIFSLKLVLVLPKYR